MSASPPARAAVGDHVDLADLEAIIDGDPAAIQRLYERHRSSLFAFLTRFVSDRQLAEEALQDTMVAVWINAHTFDRRSRVRTWMFSIARFKALALVRRRPPDPIDPTDDHRIAEAHDRTAGPEHRAIAVDEFDRVRDALDRLPEATRECFLLAVAGTLPYDDIADILDIAVGTVKSRVARARRQLIDQLEDLE